MLEFVRKIDIMENGEKIRKLVKSAKDMFIERVKE